MSEFNYDETINRVKSTADWLKHYLTDLVLLKKAINDIDNANIGIICVCPKERNGRVSVDLLDDQFAIKQSALCAMKHEQLRQAKKRIKQIQEQLDKISLEIEKE
jgi:hypothetical protein